MKKLWISSVWSLLLGCALLAGTTFAWFTNQVSVTRNAIRTGTMDAALFYAIEDETATGSDAWSREELLLDEEEYGETMFGTLREMKNWQKVTETTDLFAGAWGQGKDKVLYLRVANEGNLPVRYRLGISVATDSDAEAVFDAALERVKVSWSEEMNDSETEAVVHHTDLRAPIYLTGHLDAKSDTEELLAEQEKSNDAAECIYRICFSVEDYLIGTIPEDAASDAWDMRVELIVTQDQESIQFDELVLDEDKATASNAENEE